jgi:hypothetical protein
MSADAKDISDKSRNWCHCISEHLRNIIRLEILLQVQALTVEVYKPYSCCM